MWVGVLTEYKCIVAVCCINVQCIYMYVNMYVGRHINLTHMYGIVADMFAHINLIHMHSSCLRYCRQRAQNHL